MNKVPKDNSLQAMELSQRIQTAVQIVLKPPPPAMGARFTVFGQAGHAERWMAGTANIKTGDVETNPGPTNTYKQVWICDTCHKQIHGRKQISIRCNRIEYCVNLRYAGIRQEQYTVTWTCHQHR